MATEISEYDIGDEVVLRAEFEVSSVDTDPTTVTFKVRNPVTADTAVYVYGENDEVAKVADGIYDCTIAPDAAGDWHWKAYGTGAAAAAEARLFRVKKEYV